MSGGIGAELSGGNFWEGVVTGGIVAGLNHSLHKMGTNPDPPRKSILERAKEFAVDYFDYNGNGKIDGWEYGVGVVDVGAIVYDVATIPSGEAVAFNKGIKAIARKIAEIGTKKGGSWAKTSGILRTAVKSKGNYGLGVATRGEANQAGLAWVGKGYKISRDGSSWISADGLRQYRPPSYKPKLGEYQANFQWRNINKGQWQSNGHLTIK